MRTVSIFRIFSYARYNSIKSLKKNFRPIKVLKPKYLQGLPEKNILFLECQLIILIFVLSWCSLQLYKSLNVSLNVHWFIVSLLALIKFFLNYLTNEHLRRKPQLGS